MSTLDLDLIEKESERRYASEKDAIREIRRMLSASGTPKLASIERSPEPKMPKSAPARTGTKSAKVLAMMGRPGGVTIPAIIAATKWKLNTVRGFISSQKTKGVPIDSRKKTPSALRAYFIPKL